jgi:glutamyl-tRNA synthetase
MSKIRTRFAPSPTGGLHLGGVRTALYSYLFAKKHDGQFVLRIEDTDQTRFVAGAEEYILNSLTWCGIMPDEGPHAPGNYAPYRQSERKDNYKQYSEQLIASGHAYYAFDTPEELEAMRNNLRTTENPNPQYDSSTRLQMKNSLSLPASEVKQLLEQQTKCVVRIKMPENEEVIFSDLIRGNVSFDTNLVDDKVLLKADGMPTYHLAVVVDDYLMKITHAFRGEEWLPSAPVHLLLWRYLGWEASMPIWAHLPLILKPEGNGKLSKRDGERLGFPVFAMDWTDPNTQEKTIGFKERGFLPEAFINVLALLGWSGGGEQEVFSLEELITAFDINKVHKGGAKFDFEKAKWFNQQWIARTESTKLLPLVKEILASNGITTDETLETIIELVKERCILMQDFVEQAGFFYKAPQQIDIASIQPKWTADKKIFFETLQEKLLALPTFDISTIETCFKDLATEMNIKVGELQLPMRVMLVGGKFGPAVFEIAHQIGCEGVIARINNTLAQLR